MQPVAVMFGGHLGALELEAVSMAGMVGLLHNKLLLSIVILTILSSFKETCMENCDAMSTVLVSYHLV